MTELPAGTVTFLLADNFLFGPGAGWVHVQRERLKVLIPFVPDFSCRTWSFTSERGASSRGSGSFIRVMDPGYPDRGP